MERAGAPDFLINNAAVINHNAPLWEVGSVEFDRLTAVNINGTANTIRHFVPAMINRGSGVVVNFSSGWGRSASAEVGPYCASKWAIEGLTRALAEELPDEMAAIPLNPGIINTEMLQSCFGGNADMYPSADEWAARAVPFILLCLVAPWARGDSWWAFQPLKDSSPPEMPGVKSPVDQFVLQRLQHEGMTFAPKETPKQPEAPSSVDCGA